MKDGRNGSLFIETVRIQDRIVNNLRYHNARVGRTRREVLGIETLLNVEEHIPVPADAGLFKCRIIYGIEIEEVEIHPYQSRSIRSLKLLDGGEIDYSYKYADRSSIDALFDQRADCDDVLIMKHGLITDTSYANVALYNGTQWITPSHPLLKGTKRQQLLDQEIIYEGRISKSDLNKYSEIVLFNAMIDFDPMHAISIPDGIRD